MKKICQTVLLLSLLLSSKLIKAQLAGVYTVPGSYTSVGAAIAALNSQGVSAAVTINIATGYTETVTSPGYSIGAITGASSSNQITLKRNGSGANPILYAYAGGTAVPTSGLQDGILKFIGTDYVTLDGLDLTDLNSSNPSTMEYGLALFRANSSDGCQYNTIKNCVITLNKINNAVGSFPANHGSRGIEVINATAATNTLAVLPTVSSGENSNNKFYNNLIQNCNVGMSLYGNYQASSPYTGGDFNNDIGGTSSATSNTIINFGGGGSNISAYGIIVIGQYNLNISNNLVISNNGSGVNHAQLLKGISMLTTNGATATVSNNTVTVHGGGTTDPVYAIENQTGSNGGNVTVSNNLITNCTYTTSTTGPFTAIYNTSGAALLTISGNTITGVATSAISGQLNMINHSGSPTLANITGNSIKNVTLTASSTTLNFYGVQCTGYAPTATLNVTGNSLESFYAPGSYSGSFYFVYNFGQTLLINISNNIVTNLVVPTTGNLQLFYDSNSTPNHLVSGNTINGLAKSAAGGLVHCYYNASTNSTVGVIQIINNNFSNITVSGGTSVYGILSQSSYSPQISVSSNTVNNIIAATGTLIGVQSAGGFYMLLSSNKISNLSGGSLVMGLNSIFQSADSLSVLGNTINSVFSTGATTITGYNLNQGTYNLKFMNNLIYDFAGNHASSIVKGVVIYSGFTVTIANNIIGDLRAPAASNANAISGLYLEASSPVNVYYNTIYLNAASSGFIFGSSAFYNYSGIIDMKNNIFINKSSPNSTGITAAVRGVSTYTGYFSSGSNFNLFYAGTPSANRLLFVNNTYANQTISSLQSNGSPREANSVTEDVSFTSTVSGSAGYLHVNPLVATLVESGAINLTSRTTDFDGQIRQGNTGYSGTGTAPDIGADEFAGLSLTCGSFSAGSISSLTNNICQSQSPVLTNSSQSNGPAFSYQWKVSGSSTGPFTDVSGGSGANTPTYSPGALSPGTFYFVMVTTCTATSVSATTSVYGLTVNASPTISVANGTLCAGNSYTLNPSGASSYTFSGGSSVVSPTVSTTYTIYGMSAQGCVSTNTVTSFVTVSQGPTITVNSGSICSGNSFTLSPSGASSYSYQGGNAIVSPLSNTNYTVTGYSSLGCISPSVATASITVVTSPTITANSGAICQGGSFTINPSGAFAYTYSGGSNVVSPGANAFYTVTGTGVNGCVSAPVVITITVNPNPVISVNSGSICAGNTFVLSPSGAFTYTYSGGSANVSPSNNTSYSVTGTSTAGCVSSNTAVSFVSVFAIPTIAVNSGTICAGNSFTMSPTGANSYTYQGGSAIVTPLTNSSYTVIGASAAGCVSNGFVTSVVSVAATPTVTANSGAICQGSSFTINPSGAFTYTFSGGSNIVTPLSNSFYTVTGTSAAGCVSGPAVITVTVNTNPVISVNSGSICIGSSFALSPGGAFTYTYLNGSSIVSPTTNTSYSVIGTSTAGCVSSNTAVSFVSVFSIPTIAVNSGSICSGSSFTILPTGANSYTYQGGSAVVSPASTTNYTVIGANTAGCVSNGFVVSTVSVVSNPTVSVNSGSMCQGSSFILNPTGALTYTITGNSATVSPLSSTAYSVTGTGAGGCLSTNTAISNVTVHLNPTITVNSGTICAGQIFTMTPGGAFSYLFSNGSSTVLPLANASYSVSGTSSVGCISNLAIASVTVLQVPVVSVSGGSVCAGSSFTLVPLGASTYTYSNGGPVITPVNSGSFGVTGSSTAGCVSAPAVANITVHAVPAVTITGVSAICNGSPATLTVSGANSYLWNNSSTLSIISVTPNVTTSYTATGTSSNGCTNFSVKTVTVYNLPSVSASATATLVCAGSPVTLNGSGAVSYSWSGTVINGTAFTPTTTSGYTVTGTDLNGCQNNTVIIITVNSLPQVTSSASNDQICVGNSVTLSGSGAITYTWTGGITNNTAFFPNLSGSYTVTGTDANGCKNSAIHSIIVNPLPTVTVVSTNNMICEGETATLTAGGANLYSWSNGGNAGNIIVSPTVSTLYTLTGTDLNGCVNSIGFTQNVNPCTGINTLGTSTPEAVLYPNPSNGEFRIKISDFNSNMVCEIYNSEGKSVFLSEINSSDTSISLSHEAFGIYFIRITLYGELKYKGKYIKE